MTGDMPQVCPDRRYISFMYSYPNFVPVSAATVCDIVGRLEPYAFSKLHGALAEVRGGGRSERSPAAIGRAVLEGVGRHGAVMDADFCADW